MAFDFPRARDTAVETTSDDNPISEFTASVMAIRARAIDTVYVESHTSIHERIFVCGDKSSKLLKRVAFLEKFATKRVAKLFVIKD